MPIKAFFKTTENLQTERKRAELSTSAAEALCTVNVTPKKNAVGRQTLTGYFTSRFLLSSWVRWRREAFSSYKTQRKKLLHFHSNVLQNIHCRLHFRDYSKCITCKTERKVAVNHFLNSQKDSDWGKLWPYEKGPAQSSKLRWSLSLFVFSASQTSLANIAIYKGQSWSTVRSQSHQITPQVWVFSLPGGYRNPWPRCSQQAVARSEQSHPVPKPHAFVWLAKKHEALMFTYPFSQSLSRKDVKKATALMAGFFSFKILNSSPKLRLRIKTFRTMISPTEEKTRILKYLWGLKPQYY